MYHMHERQFSSTHSTSFAQFGVVFKCPKIFIIYIYYYLITGEYGLLSKGYIFIIYHIVICCSMVLLGMQLTLRCVTFCSHSSVVCVCVIKGRKFMTATEDARLLALLHIYYKKTQLSSSPSLPTVPTPYTIQTLS